MTDSRTTPSLAARIIEDLPPRIGAFLVGPLVSASCLLLVLAIGDWALADNILAEALFGGIEGRFPMFYTAGCLFGLLMAAWASVWVYDTITPDCPEAMPGWLISVGATLFLVFFVIKAVPAAPMHWATVAHSWSAVVNAEHALGRETSLGKAAREAMQTREGIAALGFAPDELANAKVATDGQLQMALALKNIFEVANPTPDFVIQNGLVRDEDARALRRLLTGQYERKDLTREQLALVATLGSFGP